jgi:hypothetical protein
MVTGSGEGAEFLRRKEVLIPKKQKVIYSQEKITKVEVESQNA